MVRAFMIALVPIVSPSDSNAQVVMLLVVLTIFLALQCLMLPWKTTLLNVSDTAIMLMLLVIVGVASVFSEQVQGPAVDSYTTLIIAALATCFTVVAAWSPGPRGQSGLLWVRPPWARPTTWHRSWSARQR